MSNRIGITEIRAVIDVGFEYYYISFLAANIRIIPEITKLLCNYFIYLIFETAEAAGEPNIHLTSTTMVPGVVGDEFDSDILGGEFAFIRDGGFLDLS